MRYISFAIIFFLFSCSTKTTYEEFDLMKHGLPIKIKAPDNPDIELKDMGIMKDLSIRKGDDFYIQILNFNAISFELANIVLEKKKEVEQSGYFSKIISETKNGFIFEKKFGEDLTYDFRYVKIIGDQEYNFQTGLIGRFSKEAVEIMFESVQ